jgi:hypothetical protein
VRDLKTCSTCKLEKPFGAFHSKPRSACKACVNLAAKRWRDANLEQARGYFKEERKKISEWKAARGCTICAEKDPCCLDMHHTDPTTKHKDPSRIGKFESFLKEAEKCIVVCRNCHAKIHAKVILLE